MDDHLKVIECPCCQGQGFDENTPDEFVEEYGYHWECKFCNGSGYVIEEI